MATDMLSKTRSSFLALVSDKSLQAIVLPFLSSDSCTTLLLRYESLLNFPVVSLGQYHRPSSTLRHSGLSVAFNATCKSLKQDLRRIYNDYRSSRDTKLFNSYLYTKQSLTMAIQFCSQQAIKNNWRWLEKAISSNNSKLFWRLVSGHLSPPRVESNILAASWASHLKNLFFDDNVHEPPLEYPILDDSSRWPPVTADEVALLIGQIKNGKAPVPDKIPSDISKPLLTGGPSFLPTCSQGLKVLGLYPNPGDRRQLYPSFKKVIETFPRTIGQLASFLSQGSCLHYIY